MIPRIFTVAAAATVLATALVACGQDGGGSAATPAIRSCQDVDLRTPPTSPVELRLAGANGAEVYAPFFAMEVSPAQTRPNAGKWYTLETAAFSDPAQRVAAFRAGQFDGFISSIPPIFALQQQGIEAKAVAAVGVNSVDHPTTPQYIVKAGSTIRSFKEASDAAIGSIGLGTGSELAIRMSLEAAGLGQDSVKIVNIPIPQQVSSVAAGSVDIGLGVEPYLSSGVHGGTIRVLGSLFAGLDELAGQSQNESATLLFGDDFLQAHPGVVCAYLADYRSTLDWLRHNLADARELFSERDLVALPYEQYKDSPEPEWPAGDAVPNVALYKAILPYAEKYGLVPNGTADSLEVEGGMVWSPVLNKGGQR